MRFKKIQDFFFFFVTIKLNASKALMHFTFDISSQHHLKTSSVKEDLRLAQVTYILS